MKRLHHRLRALAIAAAMACAPMVARADPLTVFAVVEAAVGATVAGAVATAVSFITTYGSYIAIAAGALDARRKARKAANAQRAAYNASLTDRTTVALTADPPLRAIYGRCIVGGDVVAVLTSDKTGVNDRGAVYVKADGYKHVVIVIAARQIQAIHDVLIEGVPLGALDADGWPIDSDTVRTVRGYRELSLAAGASYTVPSGAVVHGAADNSGGGALDEGGTLPGPPPAIDVSPDGRTVTNPHAFPVALAMSFDLRVGSVRVSKFLGTPDQAADPWLRANVPDLWTVNDRLRGLAGIVLTLDLEDTSHQAGIPKVEIDASGHLVHDPRDGATRWTSNPALIIRDYLTSEIGFGVAAADIDEDSVIAAANACDDAVVPVDGTGYQARFTCNGTLTSDDDREAVLDDLADSMAGQVMQGAAWRLVAGAWAPPLMDLGDDDLAGQAEVLQGDTPLDDLFNGARARIVPAGSGTVDEPVPYQNATFVAADGEALWTDVPLPYTNSAQRARNVLRILVERNRAGLVARVPFKLRAWPLQVGDRVRWTSSEYGFYLAPMQVVDWQFGLAGAVMLTLQADAPEIYDLADAVTATVTAVSSLPRPWVVASVSGLAASSGTDTLVLQADGTVLPRVRLSWSELVDPYLAGGGFFRVRWRRPFGDPGNAWRERDAGADATGAWINGVAEGDGLVVSVQAFNRLGAAGKAAIISHTVVGKSAAASNVTGLAASVAAGVITWSWAQNPDLDRGHTEVRAADSNWGLLAPTPLWRGDATSWQEAVSAAGTVTRYVRHVDSSGHPSAATATASVTVGPTDLAGAVAPNSAGALNADPACVAPSAWELLNGAVLGTTTLANAVGAGCVQFPGDTSNPRAFSVERIPINAARRYRLTARLWAAAGNDRNMYVTVRMFRADGSELVGSDTGWGGGYAGYVYGGLPTAGVLGEYGADFGSGTAMAIPAAAAWVRVGVWGRHSGTGTGSGAQLAQDVRLTDVTDVRAAQAGADAANTALAAIASDGWLTRGEKPAVILDWTSISNEQAGIDARAAAYGITGERGTYSAAVAALAAYLSSLYPAWEDTAVDTPIVGATWRCPGVC